MEEDTYTVIWYDSNVDELDTSTTKKSLLDVELNSCLIRCTDLEFCVSYVKSMSKRNVYFITTVPCAYDILPLIHSMRQIDSVFLFSDSHENSKDLLDNYPKMIACFYNTKTLTESVQENIELAQKQKMVFSYYNQNKKPTRELSKESALFLWFQLFKNALLNMPSEDPKAKQDLVEFLQQRYRNNNKQMKLIEKFQQTYKSADAIHWYTGQPFLYRHINKALRTEDIGQLYTFRFFIADLCKSLLHEYKILKEYAPRVTLYRGTRMVFDEYDKFKENYGHLISMNGFVSTSLEKDVALTFAGASDTTHQAVLFEIECDLGEVETIVLAQIVAFSAVKSEQEVLIDIGAVFQVVSVELEQNLGLIKLKATDEGAKVSKSYLEINQEELKEKNVRIIWGDLLLDMGHHEQALQYFEKLQLLDGTVEDWQLQIHIGHVLFDKGLHDEAIAKYLYANELWEKQASTQNISILSHISKVLMRKGLFEQTLRTMSQNLNIYESDSTMEHDRIYYHDIAHFFSAMAHCYLHQGEYELAITYLNRAYNTREDHYSCDHFESAENLDQLGIIYRIQGHYKRSLHLFSHAKQVYERTFPSNHPKVIDQLVSIAQTFIELDRKKDALKYLRKALALQEITPANTPMDRAFILDILALISSLENNEEDTVDLIRRALETKRTFLNDQHPDIANDLTTLANIFKEQGHYDEANANYMEALAIYEKIRPDGHPQAAIVLHGIGFIYRANDDYETALSYYIKAQTIYQNYFLSSNSNFIRLVLSIAEAHQLKGELSLAMESLKDCLNMIQKQRPNDVLLLRRAHMMLADTYMLDDKVVEALYSYEKGFSIDVDDEIEHYVYHVGYRLLMGSCTLESRGKVQQAQNMRKNASIIFQKYDIHTLFGLVERLLDLRTIGYSSDGVCSALEGLYAKVSIGASDVVDVLRKDEGLESYPPEKRDVVSQITYYHDSMYLFQKLLMDVNQRASATALLACHYEKHHRNDLAQRYYSKAQTLYTQLMTDPPLAAEMKDLTSIIDDINIRISDLEI